MCGLFPLLHYSPRADLTKCSLQFPLSLLSVPCYWCHPPSRVGPGHVTGWGVGSVIVPGSSLDLSLPLSQGDGLSVYTLAHYPCPSLAAPHTISGLSAEPLAYPWSRNNMCSSVEVAIYGRSPVWPPCNRGIDFPQSTLGPVAGRKQNPETYWLHMYLLVTAYLQESALPYMYPCTGESLKLNST